MPPTALVLTFNTPLLPMGGHAASVTDPAGEDVTGPIAVEGSQMTVAVAGEAPGDYAVTWQRSQQMATPCPANSRTQ